MASQYPLIARSQKVLVEGPGNRRRSPAPQLNPAVRTVAVILDPLSEIIAGCFRDSASIRLPAFAHEGPCGGVKAVEYNGNLEFRT